MRRFEEPGAHRGNGDSYRQQHWNQAPVYERRMPPGRGGVANGRRQWMRHGFRRRWTEQLRLHRGPVAEVHKPSSPMTWPSDLVAVLSLPCKRPHWCRRRRRRFMAPALVVAARHVPEVEEHQQLITCSNPGDPRGRARKPHIQMVVSLPRHIHELGVVAASQSAQPRIAPYPGPQKFTDSLGVEADTGLSRDGWPRSALPRIPDFILTD